MAVLFLCLQALLPNVALAGTSATYTVAKGDNLTIIARCFGVTVAELQTTNGLTSDLLAIGQKLQVDHPFRRWHQRPVHWRKPVPSGGRILRAFGPYKRRKILMPSTGVDVAAPVGTKITCPADGIVRHIGHMAQFGMLMIIEHGDGYATVLAPFDPQKLSVKIDQAVRVGYLLGISGTPAPDLQPHVHLELRKNNKAINPDRLLP